MHHSFKSKFKNLLSHLEKYVTILSDRFFRTLVLALHILSLHIISKKRFNDPNVKRGCKTRYISYDIFMSLTPKIQKLTKSKISQKNYNCDILTGDNEILKAIVI